MLRLCTNFIFCYCLMILAYLMQSMVTFAVFGGTSALRSVTFKWRFTRPVARRWSTWLGPPCDTWTPMSQSKFIPCRHCQLRIRYFIFKLWIKVLRLSSVFYLLVLIFRSFVWGIWKLVIIALSWERRSQYRIIASYKYFYIFIHSGSSSAICPPHCSSIFFVRPIRNSSWGPIGFIVQIRTSMYQIVASTLGTPVFRCHRQKSSVSFTYVTIFMRFKLLTSDFLINFFTADYMNRTVRKGGLNGAWRSDVSIHIEL